MYVFHPKAWLNEMPKGARFYLSKEDLRVEHPTIDERHIVKARYAGPATEEFLVLKPVAPGEAPKAPATPAPKPSKKSVKKPAA
jgi:hypothetical protein